MTISFDKEWLQYLHVTSKYKEIYLPLQEVEHAHLIFVTLFLADGKVVVGDIIHVGERFQVGVITDNTRNIHGKFTALTTPEQYCKTMVEFCYKNVDLIAVS